MPRPKRIRTLLHKDQRIFPGELQVLHTRTFQRLYELHQLGLADRVFIDASHSRIHHVVGVLEQADKLVRSIAANLRLTPERHFEIGQPETTYGAIELAARVEGDLSIVRLVGLLHDLTHAPFGHTVEDEIQLIDCKHDEPGRQAEVFYRLVCEIVGWLGREAGVGDQPTEASPFPMPFQLASFLDQPEDAEPPREQVIGDFIGKLLTQVADGRRRTSWKITLDGFARLLAELRAAMTGLLHLHVLHEDKLESKHFPPAEGYPFQRAIEKGLQGTPFEALLTRVTFQPHRDAYMLDVIGNTVCADLLDYAARDAHFTNIRVDYDADRIAENFTLVAYDPSKDLVNRLHRQLPDGCVDPFAGSSLRTGISVFSHKLRTDVPGELMNLLNARFYLYERAVYHPTKCAAGAMLGTALQLIWNAGRVGGNHSLLPPGVRRMGDSVFLHEMENASRIAVDVLTSEAHRGGDQVDARWQAALQDAASTSQVRLARQMLLAHIGRPVPLAVRDLRAALRLLNQLRARRYLRPVFRALPSVQDQHGVALASTVAKLFGDSPATRFLAERKIEEKAGLEVGAVVIHCPKKIAAKIANALMVIPTQEPDTVLAYRLCDIGQWAVKIFEKHEHAIRAVQDMYQSMWRLVVYVQPEHLDQHLHIAAAAREVISEMVTGEAGRSTTLANDPMLEMELHRRAADTGPGEIRSVVVEHPLEGPVRIGFPALEVGRRLADAIGDDNTERLRDMLAQEESRDKITKALLRATGTRHKQLPLDTAGRRLQALRSVLRPYTTGIIGTKELQSLEDSIRPEIATLSHEEAARLVNNVEIGVRATPRDLLAARTGAKAEAEELRAYLIGRLRECRGVRVPSLVHRADED